MYDLLLTQQSFLLSETPEPDEALHQSTSNGGASLGLISSDSTDQFVELRQYANSEKSVRPNVVFLSS